MRHSPLGSPVGRTPGGRPNQIRRGAHPGEVSTLARMPMRLIGCVGLVVAAGPGTASPCRLGHRISLPGTESHQLLGFLLAAMPGARMSCNSLV